MFVRVKEKPNGKKSIQIVESVRTADKVTQKIIRHVGQAVGEREVEEMKRLAEAIIASMEEDRQPRLPLFDPEAVAKTANKAAQQEPNDNVRIKNLREEQRVVEGITDVFGKLYDDLGLRKVIAGTRKDAQWNDILRTLVLARLANPVSKRRSASLIEEDFGITIDLDKIYRMMDHVASREAAVKQAIGQTTLNLFEQKVDVLFFDVTTLYFESIESNDLKDFGFSKDCKFKEVQVMLALVTTTHGLPITYRLFPGCTFEGKTLLTMIDELKKEFSIANILLVADRAMFSEENLKAMDDSNVSYVVAAKLRSLPKDLKTQILSDDAAPAVVENELHWLNEFKYKSRRLIVSYSASRAKKDAADRNRLVERVLKKAKDDKLKLKDLIPNYGTKKFVTIDGGDATLNHDRIEADAEWDGLHGIISNVKDSSAVDLLTRYRGLWQIEAAFRLSKHDLKMRPIFHWTEDRIKSHIAICFIAFTIAKQSMYRVAVQHQPMSFEQIRNELLHTQSSVLVDITTSKKYVIPSKVTANQKKLYQIFGLKRSEVPRDLI